MNLYDNPLNEAIVELSLKGKQMTVTNHELAPDLSTKGCFPKAWIRTGEGFKLLKDGGAKEVKKNCWQVKYVSVLILNKLFTRNIFMMGSLLRKVKLFLLRIFPWFQKWHLIFMRQIMI